MRDIDVMQMEVGMGRRNSIQKFKISCLYLPEAEVLSVLTD